MNNELKKFLYASNRTGRNPLGIIALFLILIYGLASLVTAFLADLTLIERLPLIYFLIIFPLFILFAFLWLVSKHSDKLYGPRDFRDEENYVRIQIAANLGAAKGKTQDSISEADIKRLVELAVESDSKRAKKLDGWRRQILWVDDRPHNNIYERKALEALGLRFTLSESTNEAINKLNNNKFAAIISDMGRREGPREGYVLLDGLRKEGNRTPFFIYASSNAPEHKEETRSHGGDGCTNDPQELFEMVTRAVIERQDT
ncbi:MAG: response regulator, partial [Rhodospirillaceae bacterium]|nr:response regulator [Rhodospirillaceae bacterium]MDE0618942.1 response regulator [Rhodospirillaceae bacterium]MDE0717672.1 response regulator [Rhodospirillaceae bacterium]